MTPEAALELAKYQRPGVVLQVGPTEAKEARIRPLSDQRLRALPGDATWLDRHLRLRLGYVPSAWAKQAAKWMTLAARRRITDDEWRWLAHPQTGIAAVEAWCVGANEARP